MAVKEVAERVYVTRGEFTEFREEVRGALAEVARTLRAVPTKDDVSSAISSGIGASRQVSPAWIGALVVLVGLGVGAYSNDQGQRDKFHDSYRIATNQRFSALIERLDASEERAALFQPVLLKSITDATEAKVRIEYLEKLQGEHREDRKEMVTAIEKRFDQRTRDEAEARAHLDTMLQRELKLNDEIDRLTAEVNRLKGNGYVPQRGGPTPPHHGSAP